MQFVMNARRTLDTIVFVSLTVLSGCCEPCDEWSTQSVRSGRHEGAWEIVPGSRDDLRDWADGFDSFEIELVSHDDWESEGLAPLQAPFDRATSFGVLHVDDQHLPFATWVLSLEGDPHEARIEFIESHPVGLVRGAYGQYVGLGMEACESRERDRLLVCFGPDLSGTWSYMPYRRAD